MAQELEQLGRLAFREEGDHWNAYFAQPDTMDRAVWLGSIHVMFVRNPQRKAAFMALMREAFGDVCEGALGQRPLWPSKPVAAPEHERTKSA